MNKSEGKILLKKEGFTIFGYVDFHFRAQLIGQGHCGLGVRVKEYDVPGGALSSELRKLGMSSVIGERELGYLELDGRVLPQIGSLLCSRSILPPEPSA